MATLSSAVERARMMAAFVASGSSPGQWVRLGVLGWSRGNPSGWLPKRVGAISVSPSVLHGRTVVVDATDLGHLVSFEEIFVLEAYDLARVPFQPQLIVDCGAHAGFFAALAAARFPQTPIVAFEPNPVNVEWLRQNLGSYRATVHDAAVSIANGNGRFTALDSNAGQLTGNGGSPVRVVDLRQQLPASPDLLLKIDVEGEETRLLPHLLPALPSRCALFVETHHGSEARHRLSAALTAAGFAVTQVREREPYADLFALRSAA
jgi:FkbM family methyltransferase